MLHLVGDGRLFFRVIEHGCDEYACHHGHYELERYELDRHDSLRDALRHVRHLARVAKPSRVIVHHLDGRSTTVADFD